MVAKKWFRSGAAIFSLIVVGALLYAGFTRLSAQDLTRQLQQGPLNLDVPALAQSNSTSCGEAAIVIAHNYAHPATPISEVEVIAYAAAQGYFTEDRAPYTSPENMVKIARHYAGGVSAGTVVAPEQGLVLLYNSLQGGDPVIIDVRTRLEDPESEAHFVVVTGMSVDPGRDNAIVIRFNDPQTGGSESADWTGDAGIWNSWINNRDPGGPGWWMAIHMP